MFSTGSDDPATAAAPFTLADRLACLSKYYSYKDVLEIGFGGDEDRFIDAYCDGSLPIEVRRACFETMGDQTLQTQLLRRAVRLLGELLVAVRTP